MSNPALDQTTLEESFFFCEYAKRSFEMSAHNNGQIENAMKYVQVTSRQVFIADIAEGMQIDLLADAVCCHEACIMSLRHITPYEGYEEYIVMISGQYFIENLLLTSYRFNVNAAFLPFPYDMVEVATRVKCGGGVPITFKILDRADRRCVISFNSNRDYIFFGIDKNLSSEEMIDILKKKVTLIKSINNYENCKRKDILKDIHKQSNFGSHRQSLNNVFYKATGLLIYDLYIHNNFELDRALEEYRKLDTIIKCDPSKKLTSEDCVKCNHFGKCESYWRKLFKAAVEKISGEEDNEAYLTRIKNEDKVNKIKRRPISFFEYEFRATVPQS